MLNIELKYSYGVSIKGHNIPDSNLTEMNDANDLSGVYIRKQPLSMLW